MRLYKKKRCKVSGQLGLSGRFAEGQKRRMENQSGRSLAVKPRPQTDRWQEIRGNGVLIGLTTIKAQVGDFTRHFSISGLSTTREDRQIRKIGRTEIKEPAKN